MYGLLSETEKRKRKVDNHLFVVWVLLRNRHYKIVDREGENEWIKRIVSKAQRKENKRTA